MNATIKQQIQTLWVEKTSFEEFQTHQILIDEPVFTENDDETITYVQRSQCRTTHKRKDC